MMAYIVHISIITATLWWFGKGLQGKDRMMYFAGAFMKITGGLFFGWLYIQYLKGGDTLGYFHASFHWYDLFRENTAAYWENLLYNSEGISSRYTGEPRAVFMVKIVSLISLAVGTRYWLISMYFSLAAFAAAWYFFLQLKRYQPLYTNGFWLVLFAFPGLLFWGGGVLKETVAIISLFVMAGLFIRAQNRERIRIGEILVVIFVLYLILQLKYYVLAVFLPSMALASYFIVVDHLSFFRVKWTKYTLLPILIALAVVFVINLSPNFQPDYFLYRVVADHDRLLKLTDTEFSISYEHYEPTVYSFLVNAPKAIFSGLFRPMIMEGSGYQLLSGVQNLFLLLAVIWGIYVKFRYQVKVSVTVWCCLLYCVVMATFLAYATPNFGTLERYKSMFQPFLLLALVPVFYPSKTRIPSTTRAK